MKRRDFLAAASVAGMSPATPSFASSTKDGPPLLTIGGAITRSNRGARDGSLDQLMVKHEVDFRTAWVFDSHGLQRLPAISIRPTLEYDGKPHKLTGPLLTTVLAEAGASPDAALQVGIRAIDGYRVTLALADAASYGMILATHIDDQALALGGLGPQWAVFDPAGVPALRDKPLKEQFAQCPWGAYYIHVSAS